MAMLQVLCPEFLQENRLYWLRAPIYKVETKKKNYYYYTEEEFQKNKVAGNIIRYKGLGQMNEQDLKESMFSEEFQHLEPITYSQDGIEQLQNLMGTNVSLKKQFVTDNINFREIAFE